MLAVWVLLVVEWGGWGNGGAGEEERVGDIEA